MMLNAISRVNKMLDRCLIPGEKRRCSHLLRIKQLHYLISFKKAFLKWNEMKNKITDPLLAEFSFLVFYFQGKIFRKQYENACRGAHMQKVCQKRQSLETVTLEYLRNDLKSALTATEVRAEQIYCSSSFMTKLIFGSHTFNSLTSGKMLENESVGDRRKILMCRTAGRRSSCSCWKVHEV